MIAATGTLIAAAFVLIIAAVGLTKAADSIAEWTGIGRIWIGVVLVAGATSLPEAAVDVSAVRVSAPDIAAGDLFGSSMANMLILAIVDLWPPGRRLLRGAALDHALAACFAILLNAMAAVSVLLRPSHEVFGFSLGSIMILAVYLAGIRVVYRQTMNSRDVPLITAARTGDPVPRASIVRFALSALTILVVAPFFAGAAKDLAELSGLSSTFVGTFLVGLSTSVPELVSSLAAVKMGAFDLAVGNLFGSNAFNMVVFFAMDAASPTPIFAALDATHGVTALFAIVLMALGTAAIVYRAELRYRMIEPDSLLMVAVYVVALWLVFTHATHHGVSLPGHPG